MNLTADVVKGLAATDKPKTFYDSKLTGFGLCCRPPSTRSPEGSASWIYEYRPGGGRRNPTRRVKLGSYPEIEIADARKLAKAAIKAVLNGEDPAQARREAREALTLRELAGRYQAEAAPGRKAGTRVLYETYWRLHVFPELGSMKARDVKRSDVAKLHRTVGAKHPTTANRCVTLLRHFYNWAAKVGEVPEGFNPAGDVSRYREAARERYLSPEELERLAKAIVEAETIGIPWREPKGEPSKHRPRRAENRRSKITPHAAAAIRLLLLTGARLREILHLKCEHVDLGRGLLLLPDSKTGKKTIVLSGAALQIIADLDKTSDFVIAGLKPKSKTKASGIGHNQPPDEPPADKPRADLHRPWLLVCRGAGLTRVRLHDLRHTYASFGASGGLGLPMIGGLLGHADSKTTARYAHLANDPMRRAADLIAGGIEAAMRGGERAGG
jgi:integrase